MRQRRIIVTVLLLLSAVRITAQTPSVMEVPLQLSDTLEQSAITTQLSDQEPPIEPLTEELMESLAGSVSLPISPMAAPLTLPSIEASAISGNRIEMGSMKIAPFAGYTPSDGSLYSSGGLAIRPVRHDHLTANDIGLAGTYRLNPRTTISSNIFMQTGRNSIHSPRYFVGAANASISYTINERLTVSAYGQYSSSPLLSSPLSTSIYGTNFGIQANYQVVDFLSLQAGAEHTMYMGQWNTNYYVTPVLHVWGLSIPLPSFNFSPQHDRDSFRARIEAVPTAPSGPRPPTLNEGGSRPRHWPGKQ